MSWTTKSSRSTQPVYQGQHRLEHWYRDNQIYFMTARCRDRFPAFASEAAKAVFWGRFLHYAAAAAFEPWILTLLNNHYHVVGYCSIGDQLGTMMQRIHGSVAKLVNDVRLVRQVPFWRENSNHTYFDGCLRSVRQYRHAYEYTRQQAMRARLVTDWRDYPHTRVWLELEPGLKRALELKAFLDGVPYKRYEQKPKFR